MVIVFLAVTFLVAAIVPIEQYAPMRVVAVMLSRALMGAPLLLINILFIVITYVLAALVTT